jgi:hypothetical protein
LNQSTYFLSTRIRDWSFCLFICLIWGVASGLAQVSAPSGAYSFVSDSDGGKVGKGSTVTLTFSNGSATLNAIKPGENFIDHGNYSVAGNLITISLPQLGVDVTSQPFTLNGTTLVLPFKVFSEGEGKSTWTASGQGGGTTNQPPGDDGQGGKKGGDSGQTGPGTPGNNPGGNTGQGPGQSGKGTNGPAPQPGPGVGPMPLPNQATMAKLAGVWQGWGASYEVRFRRKNMMSVAVKHATLFTIGVNDQGEIDGGGVIAYDMDPDLCGVANLVKYTNMGINILAKLPEFYNLSKEIGEAYKLTGEGSALMKEAAAKEAANEVAKEGAEEAAKEGQAFLHEANHFVAKAFTDILKEKFKQDGAKMIEKMGEDDKEEGDERKRAGCTSVGPGTLGEAAAQVGASAVESLPVGPNMPMGVPMIPGVTQVQYNYKGLEHGPEERLYTIKGNIGGWNGETRMVLNQSGDFLDGDKNLIVQYQVNYKTEKQPFPAWSPFTNQPGIVWLSNGPKTQPPPEEVEQLAQKMGMNISAADGSAFAYLEDTGTHRNGVKPWEEYEYVWFVQKLDNQKVIKDFGGK